MSKVFKINDHDWVYAENETQAKEYYMSLISCSMEDIEEIEEVSIFEEMLYPVSDLPVEEQKIAQEMQWFGSELCDFKTFDFVIKNEKMEAPNVLASKES